MASYKITLKRSVEKDLRKIAKEYLPRVTQSIQSLSEDPYPINSRKLVGSEQTYRMRVGDYRVLYVADDEDKLVEVQRVRHRKDIYR